MSAFSDATLQLINQQISQRNELLKEFAVKYKSTTWDDVQAYVKTGHASDYYSVGDEFTCKYTYNDTEYDFVWCVAGFKDVYWENDDIAHPGMILQSKYCTIEGVQFDAPESTVVDSATETTALEGWYYWGKTGNTYTALNLDTGDTIPFASYDSVVKCGVNNQSVLTSGYNRYKMSAVRQWLNSSGNAGSWWSSQHIGDVAPSQAGTINGFMVGLDSDFLNVINPVKIQVAANTVTDGGVTDVMYDRFYLPSIEEIYGSPQAVNIEGPYFPYWKTKTGLESPSNSANNGRKIAAINATATAQNCWLRSANRGNSYHGWSVTTAGQLSYSTATNTCRCAPACVIS